MNEVPRAAEAEAALVSACLSSKDCLDTVSALLRPSDFYESEPRDVYAAIIQTSESGAVSPAAVADRCGRTVEELRILRGAAPGQAELEALIRDVRTASSKRRVIEGCRRAAILCSHKGSSLEAVLESLEKETFAVSSVTGVDLVDAADAHQEAVRGLLERVKNKGVQVPRTHLKELNRAILGLFPGNLVVVGARPGIGKSALSQNISDHILATYPTDGVITFSLEMGYVEVVERSMSNKHSVNLRNITSGLGLNELDLNRLTATPDAIASGRWKLDDSGSNTIREIVRKSRLEATKMKRRGITLRLIVVDYIQLCNDGSEGGVAKVTRGLKMLAKELGCTVIAMTQLNRGSEHRDNKRPGLSDIRGEDGGGAIEQDANVVILIYRDAMHDSAADQNLPHTAELIIAKQRAGPTGIVKVSYNPKFLRFEDLAIEQVATNHAGAGGAVLAS